MKEKKAALQLKRRFSRSAQDLQRLFTAPAVHSSRWSTDTKKSRSLHIRAFQEGKKNANSVLMVHTNKWWLHGVIGHFFPKINNLVGQRHVSGGSEEENHFKNKKTPQRRNLNSCKSGSTESFLSSMCDNRMKIRCSPGFKVEMWPAQVINCCGDTASIPRHCNKLNSWREEVPVDPIKYYFLWKTWSEINLKPFQGWQRLKLGLKRHYVSYYYHYWHQPTLNLVVETQSTPSTKGS